jgi:uncharacterized protein with FMN-binding domain
MKKILIVIAVIIAAGSAITIAGTMGMDEINNYWIPDIDLTEFYDGFYRGECKISRWALAVEVKIKNHIIEKIIITDKKVSNITDELKKEYDDNLIGTKTPVFDSVSGATSVTGRAYLIAVADALRIVEECGECYRDVF